MIPVDKVCKSSTSSKHINLSNSLKDKVCIVFLWYGEIIIITKKCVSYTKVLQYLERFPLVSGRNVLYPANVFALKIFLILNYKYCHNDNVRQIFPPTPKCHNDDIPNVSKLHYYYCKIRSLSMLSISCWTRQYIFTLFVQLKKVQPAVAGEWWRQSK